MYSVAGIDQGDTPRFSAILEHFKTIGPQVEGYIRVMQNVVGKILFYDITLVSTAYNEIVYAM